MIDIDYNRLVDRLCRSGLTKDQAWSAVSKAYISACDSGASAVNEAQMAQYMYMKALGWHWNWITKPTLIEQAVSTKDQEFRARTEGRETENITEDELFEAPRQETTDADYMAELITLVPQPYRIPVLCVVQAILKRPPTKPLTVESCRKILQKSNITNTSEYARQIYTFLTTLKRI